MLAFYDRSDFADVVKKWYDGYREVLCYGIAFYKKNCKITVKKTKDRIVEYKEEENMFCRNCGKPIDPNAAVCINCGFSNGTGDNYCPNCGNATNVGMTYCTMCGASLVNQRPMVEQKSKLAGGLLGIFLGSLGVHNFYLGYTTKAVIQLVLTVATCGIGSIISGIWGFIEGILILTGSINTDGRGIPLKE